MDRDPPLSSPCLERWQCNSQLILDNRTSGVGTENSIEGICVGLYHSQESVVDLEAAVRCQVQDDRAAVCLSIQAIVLGKGQSPVP